MSWAAQSGVCGTQPLVDAQYQGNSQVKITCGEATGFVPIAAAAGILGGGGVGVGAALGGLALVGLAAGGGGGDGTNSTNTTNNTN